MYTFLSVVTSVKDYIEIVNKFVESDANLTFHTYFDFGAIITYIIFALKQFIIDLFSLSWISSIWSIPVIVPDIASAMISEISVLDVITHTERELLLHNFNDTVSAYPREETLVSLFEQQAAKTPDGADRSRRWAITRSHDRNPTISRR